MAGVFRNHLPAAPDRPRVRTIGCGYFRRGANCPFAGHPTLGTCHAWLAAGGVSACRTAWSSRNAASGWSRFAGLKACWPSAPRRPGAAGRYLQEDRAPQRPASATSPRDAIVDAVHADNGPGWQLLRLRSIDDVLAADPEARAPVGTDIGLIAPCPPGSAADFELRAFFANAHGVLVEDPVTGSLNAAAAQYLFGAGLAKERYVAAQGRKVGADGRVVCVQDSDGAVWVAGRTATVTSGGALEAWVE